MGSRRVDQTSELVDDPAVKRRLHHASLAAPKVAFAGHDAVAEQDLDAIHALALGVVAMVGQEHALDVVGVVDDIVVDAAAGGEHAVRVAESAKTVSHQRQRFITPTEIEAVGGAGGQGHGLHPLL